MSSCNATNENVLRAASRLVTLLQERGGNIGDSLLALEAEGYIAITAPTALTLVPLVTTDAAEVYAKAVVDTINDLTGRKFRVTAETVVRAKALLRARIKVETMVAVVKFKAAKWQTDPKMAEFIQPSTLMRVSKAKEYIAQMEAGPAKVGPTATFRRFGE